VKIEQEDRRTILVSLQIIKDQVKIPKMGERKKVIKNEIIKKVDDMLCLDEITFSDIVDFSGVLMQKFDGVRVVDGYLVLRKDSKERKLKIKGNRDVVEMVVAEKYPREELEFEGGKILLSGLKDLPAIDFQKQAALKDYIDDLVFALYFNVPLTKVGIEHAVEIKRECEKSRYYKLVKKYD
jgi:hypothetical protein